MRLSSSFAFLLPIAMLSWVGTAWHDGAAAATAGQQDTSAGQKPAPQTAASPAAPAGLPRGKKLVLKDGNFQLVRSYEKKGDRVRYFSVERGAWEEIPESLVDWEATKKAEAADEKTSSALLEKVHIQESAAKAETPVDVDASLTVAPGVFLPDGEGMFAFEGKSVKKIEQVGSQLRADKKNVVKQVLSPIPIVPSKHYIEIPGTKAPARLTSSNPEFYLREVATDPERDSALLRTRRQSEAGPEIALVRTQVKGGKRRLESIRSLFGQEISEDVNEIAIQRWEVAPEIYRFTLSAPLPPGEYALAEILPGGMNMYVWDFGVDAAPASASKASSH
ncbi:MAG TPA: hypothetical protein VN087_17325 [Verrucomicrobiae bacterium]|jgi:hypothetical protein|nr:hypothetical protein [Verrucomicrobiae bacterium]